MAKKLYIGVNGVAQEAKEIYVGVNGIAKEVTKGYVGVNNEAKLFWEKQQQQQSSRIPIFYDGFPHSYERTTLDNIQYISTSSDTWSYALPTPGVDTQAINVYRKNHTNTIIQGRIATQEQVDNLKNVFHNWGIADLHVNQLAFTLPTSSNGQSLMLIPIQPITNPKRIEICYTAGTQHSTNDGAIITTTYNNGNTGNTMYPTNCLITGYRDNNSAILYGDNFNSAGDFATAALDLTSLNQSINNICIWAYQEDITIWKIDVII